MEGEVLVEAALSRVVARGLDMERGRWMLRCVVLLEDLLFHYNGL